MKTPPIFAAAALLCCTLGCPTKPSESPASPKPSAASVTLQVGVVNDEALSAAIARLRGEWSERSGGGFELVSIESASSVESLAGCDLVVFASGSLGELCEANLLRPIRKSVLESEEVSLADLFPLVRDVEVVYGRRIMALPIGCPCPLVFRKEADADGLGVDPSADGMRRAIAFLAASASRAAHRSQAATLWDSETFDPRLAEPPFVETLAELVTESGQSGGTIMLPQRNQGSAGSGVAEPLPATELVFNPLSEEWEPAPQRPATLVSSSGRLVGVTAESRNAASAFRFAAWLVSAPVGNQLAVASPAVANCRGSAASQPDDWLAGDTQSPRAASFAGALAKALRADRFLIAPRLPARERYLAALAEAIEPAFPKSSKPPAVTPADALADAAARWEAISEERGRSEQHQAYLRSVNLRSYDPSKR